MDLDLQLDHHSHHASPKRYPLSCIAHNLQTPMNIGSLFRLADAMGIEKLYLTGSSAVPPNAKIKKTSRSTEQFVSYEVHSNPIPVIEYLKNQGYRIIALEITSNSIDIRRLSIMDRDKICLVLGSERSGIDEQLLLHCDQSVHIPMYGVNSSMNVVTACTIAVYEISKHLELRNIT